MKIKFAHIGDTHIGASNFKLREREEDFERAFEIAVDKIIEEKVDFVIHSGDLFDRGRPSLKTFLFCLEQLKRLKKANIPVFIVPGSHDISTEGTSISIFERVDLIKDVSSREFFEMGEEKSNFSGMMFEIKGNKVFICGLPGRRARINEIYEKFYVDLPKDAYKIFVFHHIISDIPNSVPFSDIATSQLPKGFDYYAGGHWHSRFEMKYNSHLIVYPGSLEYCDVREMESDAEKGFYIVEVDNGKTSLKWIKVKVRKIMVRKLNCNNLSAHEATENCLKLIREEAKNLENGVLILKLEGRLKSGSRGEIDRTIIEKVSKEFGVLITQVYVSDLLDPTSAISIDIRSKSLEQIEQEYLERQKYDTKMIKVARELISILGQELGGDEIEREVNKACEIIEKEILQ